MRTTTDQLHKTGKANTEISWAMATAWPCGEVIQNREGWTWRAVDTEYDVKFKTEGTKKELGIFSRTVCQ